MKKLIDKFIILISVFLFFSCSNNELVKNDKNFDNESIETLNLNSENIYAEALIQLKNENYEEALLNFEKIKLKFPLTNESIQSQIMIAFIEYSNLNYDIAIIKFNRIINRYPSHKNIDYVYYMKALSFYEQINNEELDGNNNKQALDSFNQILNRFPNSKYAKDSEQKIILVKENIAAKHMDIALFYLNQKNYLAALKRYKVVIEDFSTSKFTPEALHRLVEVYYSLGMLQEANNALAVIGYNYPKSKWYEYSYYILNKKDKKKNKYRFFNFKNFFDNNENKE